MENNQVFTLKRMCKFLTLYEKEPKKKYIKKELFWLHYPFSVSPSRVVSSLCESIQSLLVYLPSTYIYPMEIPQMEVTDTNGGAQ